jgi:hypothetical protein
MRRCFQCGKRTDAEQLTAVGDGEFCAACFRLLLDAQTQAAPAGAEPAAIEKPRASPGKARASRACLVCERGIHGDAAVSFLGGEICAACNAQMQRELRAGEAEGAVEPALDAVAPDAAATALAAARARVTERAPATVAGALTAERGPERITFTPGAETRWCAGCERPMPGPGSYRVIAGEPYCPACVPFYSAMNLGAHPRHPTPSPQPAGGAAAASAAAASAGCDCCGAALELGASLCEGFRFCAACFTSDAELALSVARARHRRKLEALRAAIEPGKKS